jgi:hypothetical protein
MISIGIQKKIEEKIFYLAYYLKFINNVPAKINAIPIIALVLIVSFKNTTEPTNINTFVIPTPKGTIKLTSDFEIITIQSKKLNK